MHSIFVELFVHPWYVNLLLATSLTSATLASFTTKKRFRWVDALIIGGMLAAIYILLLGLKRIWYCIKKGKKTQTANDYNEKLFKTATENTDNTIQMKFTENGAVNVYIYFGILILFFHFFLFCLCCVFGIKKRQ